jgi:zinc transport system substrate-binding protein
VVPLLPPLTALVTGLLVVLSVGCGRPARQEHDRFVAAVSIPPQAWLVEQLGGDRWESLVLVAPTDSPATYQPTDSQITRVVGSDLYVRIGVPFEEGPWFAALTGPRGPRVVDLREGIALRRMTGDEQHVHEGGTAHVEDADPHIWLSPALLKQQARTLSEAMTVTDPGSADDYATRLAEVSAGLDSLSQRIDRILAPYRGHSLLVFHPSWGYFCAEFGLHQVAVEVEGKDPSDAGITHLRRVVEAGGHTALFVQPQIGGRTARTLAASLGLEVRVLDPLARDLPAQLIEAATSIAETIR